MIQIRYKCRCMANEVEISVPDRREGEDVVEWMKGCVTPAIYLDHRGRNAICMAETMEYAKIPAPENAPFFGGTPKMDS